MTDELRQRLKDVFTLEDREIISRMMDDGQQEQIASVLNIDTQAKEFALQELLDSKRVAIDPEGSKVKKEIEKRLAQGEELIQSPEDEAEWQAKLDAESKGEKVETEIKEKALTKEELCIALEKLGVEFKPTMKKAELKALLESK